MRAPCRSSANTLTAKPSGTVGSAPSGRGTTCEKFGFAGEGSGNCGARRCPATSTLVETAAATIRMTLRPIGNLVTSIVTPVDGHAQP